jgi:peptide chain release factor 1
MAMPTIEQLQEEINSLLEEMANPRVSLDPVKMKELTATHKQKEGLLRLTQELKKIETEIMETDQLVETEKDMEMKKLAEDDAATLKGKQKQVRQQIEDLLIARDPRDTRDVILEVRAGAGGDEAGLFAAELMRSYARYAEQKGWKMHLVDKSINEQGGYKEAIAECNGENVFGTLKYERGVHRVQRIPATEKQGRIHTSTVTVAVLPQAQEIDLEIKPEDLRIDTYRASGAGGQHVNKTSSAVRITHLPTNTVVAVQDERSQHKNKAKAMGVLRARLLEAEEEKRSSREARERKQQVGTGDRSEKIRTYNYPQDRITDHRIKHNWSNIEGVMQGDWERIFVETRGEMRKLKA